MANILYVSGSHRLSRFHVFDYPLPFGSVKVKSLEAAYWFVLSTQQAQASDAGDCLLLEPQDALQREPGKIRNWIMKRRDFHLSADWLLHSREVWRDILLYQIAERTGFYDIFVDEMGKFDDPTSVSIVSVCSRKTPESFVYDTGCKQSFCEQLRRDSLPYPGFNIWGQLLEEMAKVIYDSDNHPLHPRFGVSRLLGTMIHSQPSHAKSVLLVSDSQFRLVSSIELGTCVSLSGATFGQMVDFCRSEGIRLKDYHMVIYFGGIIDCQKPEYVQNLSLTKLHRFLCEDNRHYFETGEVLVCPTFPTPIVPESRGYAERVTRKFQGSMVKVVNWSTENPLLSNNGNVVPELFERRRLFHLNGTGIREAYKILAKHLPSLQEVSFNLYPNPKGVGPPQRVESVVIANANPRKRKIIDTW